MVSRTSGRSGTNGMPESRIVLDTNAVVFLTTRGNAISPGLEDALNEADLFISGITEIELFSKATLPPDEEEGLRTFLSERVGVIDLSDDVKRSAIALRHAGSLKLPDCIVAATAIVLGAVLLTNDDRLLKLSWPGLRTQRII